MECMVVWVTKNVERYPEHKTDTETFPHLVRYVDDETAGFVVDLETGDFWPVAEYFLMEKVRRFRVEEMCP